MQERLNDISVTLFQFRQIMSAVRIKENVSRSSAWLTQTLCVLPLQCPLLDCKQFLYNSGKTLKGNRAFLY